MLKVVGASWQKTRIGTYILIGAGLLVIGAFFVGYMDRPEYDGTYCATAFWTKKVGFQIENWKQQNDLVNIPKGVARICYKDSVYENGWAQIEVETQRSYPDWVQAYAAGILEGSLTWKNIYNQWANTISSSCDRDESSQKFCEWLRNLLTRNYEQLKEQAAAMAEHDHYWHQLHLILNQLEGMETGYIRGATRARSDLEEEIPLSDFLLMNAAADIQDLKIYYENYVLPNGTAEAGAAGSKNFFLPSASMLTRLLRDEQAPQQSLQLLFGHSTAGSYSSMLRIQKRYKFHYHFSPDTRSNTVPGADITFTGYPGIIGSTDDFYVVKGRQVQSIVGGVCIKNENLALWEKVDVKNMVPLVARVMAANRIAQNRRTWARAMSRHPFTGAKQWISVDLNKLGAQDNLYNTLDADEKHDDAPVPLNEKDNAAISERHDQLKNMVWIVEQLPGLVHSKDVTENFLLAGNSTWLANGVPYFDVILNASRISRDNYSEDQDLTPAEEAELTNLEAVDKYLRKRGFRGDLLGDESIAYGNIDLKLFSYNARLGMSDYHAFAGPIFLRLQHAQARSSLEEPQLDQADQAAPAAIGDERLSVTIDDAHTLAELELITERRPVRNDMRAIAMRKIGSGPFKWSAMSVLDDGNHEGHPDEWNFDKVSPRWAW
ncbi:putative phospholipase B-like lamina ancestor [Drosophila virilis]|uniref:Phospholipase B-like n=1 Tax=Drosophila virilis TaxID=7244 RepID=B4LFR2_DROVI|nr:putative phospholipase B-like lamina ancestor [Drosophila virilis]XP_015030799.1 putative phospholipase B-like lamina ancestor [Drosophila virilis]XP_032290390.1 putative phospholipase B-like lamina ancestor [Drosophila virilis]EDW69289.1 lama, isoform A [Drosophila virilis]KRF84309.1 lama, isoform B [Drosophila virilis]